MPRSTEKAIEIHHIEIEITHLDKEASMQETHNDIIGIILVGFFI